ncbi:MAG: hypothetical protein ACXAD7_25560 [Candidatus Kariarchaeaceae archaeon]|jgi:hypothetical protein
MFTIQTITKGSPPKQQGVSATLIDIMDNTNTTLAERFKQDSSLLMNFTVRLFGERRGSVREIAEHFYDTSSRNWQEYLLLKDGDDQVLLEKFQYQQVVTSDRRAIFNLLNRRMINTLFLYIVSTQENLNPVLPIFSIPPILMLQFEQLSGFDYGIDQLYLYDQYWDLANLFQREGETKDYDRFCRFLGELPQYTTEQLEQFIKSAIALSKSNPELTSSDLEFFIPLRESNQSKEIYKLISSNYRLEEPQVVKPIRKDPLHGRNGKSQYSFSPASLNCIRYSQNKQLETSSLLTFPLLFSKYSKVIQHEALEYSHTHSRYKNDPFMGVDPVKLGIINCLSTYRTGSYITVHSDEVNMEYTDWIHEYLLQLKKDHPQKVPKVILGSQQPLTEPLVSELIKYLTGKIQLQELDLYSLKVWGTYAELWLYSDTEPALEVLNKLPFDGFDIVIDRNNR